MVGKKSKEVYIKIKAPGNKLWCLFGIIKTGCLDGKEFGFS